MEPALIDVDARISELNAIFDTRDNALIAASASNVPAIVALVLAAHCEARVGILVKNREMSQAILRTLPKLLPQRRVWQWPRHCDFPRRGEAIVFSRRLIPPIDDQSLTLLIIPDAYSFSCCAYARELTLLRRQKALGILFDSSPRNPKQHLEVRRIFGPRLMSFDAANGLKQARRVVWVEGVSAASVAGSGRGAGATTLTRDPEWNERVALIARAFANDDREILDRFGVLGQARSQRVSVLVESPAQADALSAFLPGWDYVPREDSRPQSGFPDWRLKMFSVLSARGKPWLAADVLVNATGGSSPLHLHHLMCSTNLLVVEFVLESCREHALGRFQNYCMEGWVV